jgi:hypothetical protein
MITGRCQHALDLVVFTLRDYDLKLLLRDLYTFQGSDWRGLIVQLNPAM